MLSQIINHFFLINKKVILILISSLYSIFSFSQISINTALTPQQLVENILVGNGVSVTNITYSGSPISIGSFSNGNNTFSGMDEGIIICTGDVLDAVGPNSAPNTQTNTLGPSNPELEALIPGYSIYDAAILEFDFIPMSDTIRFQYAFASEEYPEWVGSAYNDVFGFFVSGINPSGGNYVNENLAIVPGTTNSFITVNTVNNGPLDNGPCENCTYYVSNNGGTTIEYDGYTTVITTWLVVQPCTSYHIKLAIGDGGDHSYDSGVFLKKNSFSSPLLKIETEYTTSTNAIEGCSDGIVEFTLENPSTSDRWINYSIGGTATNGVDYQTIPDSILMPMGSDSVGFNIIPINDGIAEGQEYVELIIMTSSCSWDTLIIPIEDYVPMQLSISGNDEICEGESTTLTANITDGVSPFSKLWNTNDTTLQITVSPSNNTTYTIDVTDACNNTIQENINILVNPNPNISISASSNTVCQGSASILTASGAITYQWVSPLSTSNPLTVSPNNNTVYQVIGTDANGCNDTADISIITQALPPIAANVISSQICLGESTIINASGAISYTWTPGSSLNSSTGASVTANPINTTTYTVIGTGANGCIDSIDAVVTVNPIPNININPANYDLCIGQNINLTASGSNSYTWSPTTNLSSTNTATTSASPNTTTTYTVVGTTAAGCSNNNSVTITTHNPPTINATPSPVEICRGSSTVLNVNGANTYTWSPSNGLSGTTGNSVTASPTSDKTYTIIGTDAWGCTDTATVYVDVSKVRINMPNSDSICIGESTNITAVTIPSSATVVWNTGATTKTINASPIVTTTYTVTATGPTGCTKIKSTVVNVNPLPTISISPIDPEICIGNSVNVTASGADSYVWTPTTDNSIPNSANTNLSPTSNATYTVVGTDANGCSNSASINITVNPLPNVRVSPSLDSICFGSTSTLTASGANTYTWSPTTNLSSSTGSPVIASPTVASTTYIVTGTDANGCTNTDTAVVAVSPIIDATANNPTICEYDSSLVSVTSNIPSTYLWSNGSTSQSFYANPNITTTFTVTVTGYNGCTNVASVVVQIVPQPPVIITPDSSSVCYGNSQILTASGANTYVWSANSALSNTTGAVVTATPLASDTFMVIGTDNNGCIDTAYAQITVLDTITVKINPLSSIICEYDSIQLNATSSGAATYSWTPSSVINTSTGASIYVNPNTAGVITVTVTTTAPNGCRDTAMTKVYVNPKPTLSLNPDSIDICIGESQTIIASGADSYIWSPATALSSTNTATVIATPNATITYQVIGSSLGCRDTATAYIGVHAYPVISASAFPTQICPNDSTTITAVGADSYLWSPNNGLSSTTGNIVKASPDSTQLFTIVGSNTWGCTDTTTVNTTVSPIPVISGSDSICDSQTATLTAVSNMANTSFLWSTGETTSSINVSPATTTTYSVTTTDNTSTCTNNTNFVVTVNGIPNLSVLPLDTTICIGESVSLAVSGADTYLWIPNNTLDDSTAANTIATPIDSTIYSVIGTTIHGCKDTVQAIVNLFPTIDVNVVPNSSYSCGGGSQLLTASGADTYSWSPAAGLSSATGAIVTAGPTQNAIYTVTGIDTNNCVDTAITIVSIYGPPTITPVSPYICLNDSVKLTANTQNPPTTYLWSTGETTKSIWAKPDSTLVYSVTVNYPGGCTKTDSDTVFVHQDTVVSAFTTTPFVCFGDTSILQATGSATYSWTGVNLLETTGDSVHAIPTGTDQYIVEGISSEHSCKSYDTLIIQHFPTTNINISSSANPLCKRDTATLTVSGAISYQWSPDFMIDTTIGSVVNVAPLSDFRYFVKGIDNNGCSNTTSILLNIIPIPTMIIMPDSPVVCQGDTMELIATGSANGYDWWPNFQCSGVTNDTLTIFPMANITYYVRGYATNGCHHDTFVYVNVRRTPLLGITPILDSICLGDSIPITAWGAATYRWSPNNTLSDSTGSTVNASPTTQTTYNVIGTSTDGCELTTSSTIKVNPNPTVSLLPANVTICENDSVQLTASGGINYQWSPNFNIIINATADTSIVFPHADTTYKVVGYNSYGCSDSAYSIIDTIPAPTVIAIPSNPAICYGDSVELTASGAVSYTWFPIYALNPNTGDSIWASPLVDTSYVVRGFSSNNCYNYDTVNIIVHPEFTPIISPKDSICFGDSTLIIAGGGITYLWSPATSLSVDNNDSVIASPLADENYLVKVYDAFGCMDSIDVDITVLALPNVQINPSPTWICINDTTSLIASGALTYAWNTSPTINTLIGDSVNVFPIIPTSYIVEGTDSLGCINNDTSLVSIRQLPNVVLSANDTTICYGDSTTLFANGAYTYSWWPNNSISDTVGNSVICTTLDTITYYIEGIDTNLCKNTDTLEIIVNPLPILSISSSDSLFCSNHLVTLTGHSNFSSTIMTWGDGTIAQSVSDNPANDTTYTMIGENIYGCIDSTDLFIQVNPFPQLNISTIDTVICYNDTAHLVSSSPLSNINYLWSNGQTSPNITVHPLNNSTYTLIATDSIGCSDTITAFVRVQPIVPLNIIALDTHICIGDTIDISSITGFPVVTYNWNTGSTISTISEWPEHDTTYYLTVVDSIGCINHDSVDILVNDLPNLSAFAVPQTICIGDTSALSVIATSNPLSFLWSTGENAQNINVTPITTTTYTVSATDSIGCVGESNTIVFVNDLPIISIDPNPAKICIGDNITLSLNSNINISTYNWSNNSSQNTINVSPITTSSYSITATDINGCINDAQRLVTVFENPILNITPSIDTICTDDSIQLFATYNHPFQSIIWSNGATIVDPFVSPMTFQQYSAIYTDDKGCKGYDTSNIFVNLRPTCTLVSESPICSSDSSKIDYFGNASLNAITNWNFGSAHVLSGAGIQTHYLKWDNSGVYDITLDITENGCTSYPDTTQITVYQNPEPTIFSLDTNTCDSLPVQFEGMPNGMAYYKWNFGDPLAMGSDTSNLQNPIYIYLVPGSFSVSLNVISNEGCPGSTVVNSMLNVWPKPTADFFVNRPVSHYDNPEIDFVDRSAGAVDWEWDFGDPNSGGLNYSTDQYPFHTFLDRGYYRVLQTVINEHSCTDTTSRIVEIDNSPGFYVPTGFSPNGDGVNDVFIPIGEDFIQETYEIIIYERWGSIVYTSTVYANHWDGNHYLTGKELYPAVFTYIIRYNDKYNVHKIITGNVTLLR